MRHDILPPLEFQGEKPDKHTPNLFLGTIYFPAPSSISELFFPEEQCRPSPRPWSHPTVLKSLLLSPEDSQVWERGVISHGGEQGHFPGPTAVSGSLRTGRLHLYPQTALCQPQMTLALQVPWLISELLALLLALVMWVGSLVPLLKEELRAGGRSGNSWRCHCRHFF